jgi:hypothetical protein
MFTPFYEYLSILLWMEGPLQIQLLHFVALCHIQFVTLSY